MQVSQITADVLGRGFSARVIELGADDEGRVVATLVRYDGAESAESGDEGAPVDRPYRRDAVLYVHGFSDYFFQVDLARFFDRLGLDFYALDLRKHGRSLLSHQTPNMCMSLSDYNQDLDAAARVVLEEQGHSRLVLVAHSTGGLTVPLWAANRPELPIAGMILNSPFFEFAQPPALRAALVPAIALAARRDPLATLPGPRSSLYGESLHRSFRGEWDYNLDWKPSPGFPARLGWLAAIRQGHLRLHRGLDLAYPSLVLASSAGVRAKTWDPRLHSADSVLDPDLIARWSTSVGRQVTCIRIFNGMHDLFLSRQAARDATYEHTKRWMRAYL